MKLLLLPLLMVEGAALGQENQQLHNNDAVYAEVLLFPAMAEPDASESGPMSFAVGDGDDIEASYSLAEGIEFMASIADVFDLGMTVNKYEEAELTSIKPKPIDEIYAVEGSPRYFSAGIRFTF